MLFDLATLFVAFTFFGAASAVRRTPHSHLTRQTPDASSSCTLVLKPTATVDPLSATLDSEFNFVIGYALSEALGENIFQWGTNFTANDDGTFTVDEKISADTKTTAQVSDIITGWVGQTKDGFSANWVVNSVTCA